jgi:hypothetical protein
MSPWPWRRPSSTLPALHAHNLRGTIFVQQDHAVDLPIRMRVVLPAILLDRVHVYSCDGDEVAFGRGRRDTATSVFGAVELGLRDPAILETLKDLSTERIVIWCSRTIVGVEALLELVPGCSARGSVSLPA